MNKMKYLTVLAAFSIMFLASLASAQTYVDGDIIRERRGYDSGISYTHDLDRYSFEVPQYSYSVPSRHGSTFSIGSFFTEAFYKLPFVQNKDKYENRFEQDDSRDFDFNTNIDRSRNFRDVATQNTNSLHTSNTGYSNANSGDFTEFGLVDNRNQFSARKDPCQTRTVHYNPSGKDRDVHYTETVCDGISYSQSDSNALQYGFGSNTAFSNSDFGDYSTRDSNVFSRDFSDIFNDDYSVNNRDSGSFRTSNFYSNSGSRVYFNWLN